MARKPSKQLVTTNGCETESVGTTQPLTISDKGKAPQNRFTDAVALFNCYTQAALESNRNDERMTDLRSCYDGMPMDLGDISEEQLQNNGNLPNINRREFTRLIDDYAGNFVAIDCGSDAVAEIRVKLKYCQSPSQKTLWEQQLTQFFTDSMKEWNPEAKSMAQYVMESGVRNTQMGIFGIGCAFFRDDTDWRWIAIPTRCALVPNGTKITLRNNSIVYVRRTYTVTELYRKRKKKGWNEDLIIKTLYEKLAENLPGTSTRMPFSDWENMVRNNDAFLQRDFRQLMLVECFVEEFDDNGLGGGVSKMILNEQGPNTEFLYQKSREYKAIQNVIIPIVDNPGPEGDWHGVKGYGDMLYDIATVNNLLWNALLTGGLISMTPMFESQSADDRQKLGQVVWSRLGILAAGLKLNQTKIDFNLQGASAIMQSSEVLMQETARNYPQGETPNQKEKTATQATFEAQKEAQLTTRQILMYRSLGLDPLFTEMYRRLTNQSYPSVWPGGVAAKNFRDKCKAVGIPPECYTDPEEVRAARNGGSGNATLDTQKAMAVLQVATPGFGQQNAKKAVVASLTKDWSSVPNFIQDVPPQDSDDQIMSLEKTVLTLGQLPTAMSFENHQKHLGTPDPNGPGHLSILATARQAAMQMQIQGIGTALDDAQKLSRVMDATVHHCGEHMQYLQQQLQFNRDKQLENVVKQLGQVLATFGKFAQSFDQTVAKAAKEAQPQQPQMSAEDQIKMDKWQTEKQILLQKAQTDLQIEQSKQNLKLGAKAEDHAVKMQFKKEDHLQKLGAQGEATLTKIQMDKAQQTVDVTGQAIQNAQQLHQNAQTHVQGLVQSDQEHQQNLAHTKAQHNLELEQQAQQEAAQPDDQGSSPSTP